METWHLNLTRSLADVWGLTEAERAQGEREAAAGVKVYPMPRPNPWTERREAKLRNLWNTGLTCKQIADELDFACSAGAIWSKAHRMGLDPRRVVFETLGRSSYAGVSQ